MARSFLEVNGIKPKTSIENKQIDAKHSTTSFFYILASRVKSGVEITHHKLEHSKDGSLGEIALEIRFLFYTVSIWPASWFLTISIIHSAWHHLFQPLLARDGFRECGTLGHLNFWGPTLVWPTWQRWARIRTGSDCNFFENWRITTGSEWENFCCFNV